MNFDWWHRECTSTCSIIVTIVEIHRQIIVSRRSRSLLWDNQKAQEAFVFQCKHALAKHLTMT